MTASNVGPTESTVPLQQQPQQRSSISIASSVNSARPARTQQQQQHRRLLGVLRLYERLLAHHPEACASWTLPNYRVRGVGRGPGHQCPRRRLQLALHHASAHTE
jgi:hypothetical protein